MDLDDGLHTMDSRPVAIGECGRERRAPRTDRGDPEQVARLMEQMRAFGETAAANLTDSKKRDS
ncbi:MAG TPA: hypothetical protein VEP49_00060 [Acidimicrobiia bacterium]|nr:hypothetical protein [Acidimicrobiia bacterium]